MKRMQMRPALFLALFLSMLSGCNLRDPDGNAAVFETTDLSPSESTSKETETQQRPETSQDIKEPEAETTDPEPSEPLEVSQPTENQYDLGNCVYAQWAEDVQTDLSDYEPLIPDMDEALPLVCFSTESTAEDFKVLSLTFESIDDDGNVRFAVEEIYDCGTMTPEEPLLVRMEFAGAIPNNGISYVDANGTKRYFTVDVSGYDGSLLLTEFTP